MFFTFSIPLCLHAGADSERGSMGVSSFDSEWYFLGKFWINFGHFFLYLSSTSILLPVNVFKIAG